MCSTDTRSAKPFSKQAYENGVVIVQCSGCKGRHLLADRLGWFGEDGSVEDILARHGQGNKCDRMSSESAISRHQSIPCLLAYGIGGCLLPVEM